MGWEDLLDVVEQVQDSVEMARAEPKRGRIGWCNGVMMYIGLFFLVWFIIPALLFKRSQEGWLKGRHRYPTYALWQGWIVTGLVAVAAPFIAAGLLREWSADGGEWALWQPAVTVLAGVAVLAVCLLLLVFGIRRFRAERAAAPTAAAPAAAPAAAVAVPAAALAVGGAGPQMVAASAAGGDPPTGHTSTPASPASYGNPSGPRRSWWGKQRKGTKVVLVLAALVAVIAVVAYAAPRIAEALKPSESELVQTLATTTAIDERAEAAADLAAKPSVGATTDLVDAARTDATAQTGLAALRDAYIDRLSVYMDRETLLENESALQETARCLGVIGDVESLQALGEVSSTTLNDLMSVRVAAAQVLADSGDPAALPHLIGALSLSPLVDPDGEIAAIASAALRDDPEAIPALIQARSESDDSKASAAIEKMLAAIGRPAVAPLVERLATMDWTDEVLAAIGEPAVLAVTNELDSDNAKVRYRALGVLLRLFPRGQDAVADVLVDDEIVPLLIEARTQAAYGDERDDAAEAVLSQIGEAAVEPLMALLTKQLWAREVLAGIGAPAVPALTVALGSEDHDLRFAAADALVMIHSTEPESVGSLTTDLDEENLKSVATNYAYYIRLGRDGSEEILIRALNKHGTEEMAVDYLNCGNTQLDEAARAWADKHGYTVFTTPGSATGPQWGEGN